jgi:hypothetical protein
MCQQLVDAGHGLVTRRDFERRGQYFRVGARPEAASSSVAARIWRYSGSPITALPARCSTLNT